MEKIIFSKFNNERRSEEFCLRTDILKTECGEFYVEKCAQSKAAVAHARNMYDAYCHLSTDKKMTDVYYAKCWTVPNGVRFEYVPGKSLEEILDECLEKKKYEEVVKRILDFASRIRKSCDGSFFYTTPDYENIFQNIFFDKNVLAFSVTNLDMVFSNIIVRDDIWNIIDYEWVFHFPIPVDFIIYRAVYYYMTASKRKELQEIGIWKLLGIEKDLKKYQLMEYRFQRYIEKDYIPIPNMYADIAGENISVDSLIQYGKNLELKNRIKIYYANANSDFSEENTTYAYPVEENRYEIKILPGHEQIRIDPSEEQGILQVSEAYGVQELELYPVRIHIGEGFAIGKGTYVFKTQDPYFYIESIRENTEKIIFNLQYMSLNENTADEIIRETTEIIREATEKDRIIENKVKKIEIATKRAEKLQNIIIEKNKVLKERYDLVMEKQQEIGRLNHELFLALQNYQSVSNSRLWRWTAPVRKINDGFKATIKKHPSLYIKMCMLKGIAQGGKNRGYIERKKAIMYYEQLHIHQNDEYFLGDINQGRDMLNTIGKRVCFSIIVPLYNTPEIYLYEMLESVFAQVYPDWELCLADGSDAEHSYVGEICEFYEKYDKRIHYKKLEKNGGISENTNVCLEMATGEYIALFDHDDYLHPCALLLYAKAIEEKQADFIYCDEAKFEQLISGCYDAFFKPDFSPDLLRSYNYICHFTVFSTELLGKVGKFRKECDGSQDYDMILRLTEQAQHIVHIPKVLYYWRVHSDSTAMDIKAKTYTIDAAHHALEDHLKRVGLKGEVCDSVVPSWYRVKYKINDYPLISIIIPNKDQWQDLKKCIDSIKEKTTYSNFEIIIIENNSVERETFALYKALQEDSRIRVVIWQGEFNYAAINNFGVQNSRGEYLLFLNNDMEVISKHWIEEMLMFVQRKDVGAAGALLYYPDDTVQHAGVILGLGGIAGHLHVKYPRGDRGYFGRMVVAHNLSAVTAACMLTKRTVFDQVEGFDERFKVAFNDVDFCMKMREKGYLIVLTPYAELYHYESKSRGKDNTIEKAERFEDEIALFEEKWGEQLEKGDPYYNPNLPLQVEPQDM